MDPRLQLAIENDDVDELYRLIGEDRKLLDSGSEDPFPDTPLHIAAAAGKTQVAMEIAILKPLFTRKLDPQGYSPMHLALQHENYHIVRALMTLDPDLVRVRGRRGITPLHYVAGKEGDNELEFLAEFLSSCRSSIQDLTSRTETAVHIAVKNHNLKAFKVLFGWLKRVHLMEILNWKNQDGNTVLHIAVSELQFEIIKLLNGNMNVHAKNFQGETAYEMFPDNPNGDQDDADRLRFRGRRAIFSTPTYSLSRFFSIELTAVEKYGYFFGIRDEAARNVILVVSTLIATATYQATLSPPGGFWQDSSSNLPANSTVVPANSSRIATGRPHQAGSMILNCWKLFTFTVLNSTAFYASIGAIWIAALTLLPNTLMVHFSIHILGLAYFISLEIDYPQSNPVAGIFLALIYYSLVIVVFWLPLYVGTKHMRARLGIDATTGRRFRDLRSKDQK